jgi:nicotinamide phosphoribosyltransferase
MNERFPMYRLHGVFKKTHYIYNHTPAIRMDSPTENTFRGDMMIRALPPHNGQTSNADNLRGDMLLKHDYLAGLRPDNTRITTFQNELVPGATMYEARRKECPMTVMTDSYKSTHFLMYPDAAEMRAYGEFRKKFEGIDDERLVVYGTKYYIENFIGQPLESSDINASRTFLSAHILSQQKIKDGKYFETTETKDISKMNYLDLLLKHRKWPVKIEAMPEGSVIRPHIPLYIITAKDEHSRLCTFLETILTMLWYPCCVATLSRHTKTLIEKAYKKSVPDPDPNQKDDPKDITSPLGYKISLETRLHDFGFRGCTSVEQSVIGGCAHLLNFTGSDTMSAAYYAQYMLNRGVPVANSIPATEHSVMTSYDTEIEAVKNLIDQFPGGLISCVWDAYDYDRMLNQGLPLLKDYLIQKNCTLVVRPDSGDPVDQVLKALKAGEKAGFPVTENTKGYKVFQHFAVLQGDGINIITVRQILDKVLEEKFAACNVAFGMGGGLLQKVNRDTMSFATKLCYMKTKDGKEVVVVKAPAGQEGKMSFGGKMTVLHEVNAQGEMTGPHFVCTEEAGTAMLATNKYKKSMQVIYDGTVDDKKSTAGDKQSAEQFRMETFQDVRNRLASEWNVPINNTPAVHSSLKEAQEKTVAAIRERKFPTEAVKSELPMESSTKQLLHMLDKFL